MLERILIYEYSLNKQAKPSPLYNMITLLDLSLVIMILVLYVRKCGPGLIITFSLINLKIDVIAVN